MSEVGRLPSPPQRAHPGRSVIGGAVLLTLLVAGWWLLGLGELASGRAIALTGQASAGGPDGLVASEPLTPTVYLPFVARLVERNVWQAEYYANADLSGEPAQTAREVRVDYNWWEGAPPGLPPDHFSARWSGTWHFETGEYTFFVHADDGIRLWLDDSLLLDDWSPGIYDRTIERLVEEGWHDLKVEYFEQTGEAAIRLFWYRTDLYPQWEGTYYRQPWVEGDVLRKQTDRVIQFDWGNGCPAGLYSCDYFSVAWRASPLFVTGTHRIHIYADDGYQLYVDGTKLKEGGYSESEGRGEDAHLDLTVSSLGRHDITYNFQDRGGLAEARLWIQDLEQPEWTVEYFSNPNLDGVAVVTRTDVAIFHDWKWGSPSRKLPDNHFSVRWTGQRYFHSGCYRFGLFADDGVRLWVDGELLVDEWHDGRGTYFAPVTYLSAGEHTAIVEYYEDTGEAEIRFWW